MLIERDLRVVTAPNPGFMTGDGTNQYLLGGRRVTLIDAALGVGPNLDALRAELEAFGGVVERILITHIHPDHLGGALELRAALGARLGMHASRRGYGGVDPDWLYQDGDAVRFDGGVLRVVHTPGHESGHCCFYEPERRWLFTGDHVVGQGTVVIAPPNGDMGDYITSLRRLLELPARLLLGAHGPVITDPRAKIQEYIDHRLMRERQVLDSLRAGLRTVPEIVARLYFDVHPALHPVAEKSVQAHLIKLEREGKVRSAGGAFAPANAD
ncbi:MAG: MBL fold metallo-hydrolase [Deltaproteobacteria bacterium]|nr:MBL fold metallo-hydrolase [Deltaproteobacteria bacterium]